jgi:asparagine synthase (glutamine-hydrolysing)
MSGLVGLVGTATMADARALSMAMAVRGNDGFQQWRNDGVVLGVGRYEWEMGHCGRDLVVNSGSVTAVADATLYDLPTLDARLRDSGTQVDGTSATHRIIAAYRTWGTKCVTYLNGDYAFILWDARKQLLVGARSAGGKRPLFIAESGGGAVIASTIAGVLGHPGISDDLHPAAIASAICAFPSVGGPETAYRAIRRIGAGEAFLWEHGRLRFRQFWHVPTIGGVTATADFAAGAEELAQLLREAVGDRLGPDRTAVWLSGGWDSTAVWGIGQDILRADEQRRMFGVSISYPPGDPGREDEFIRASAEHWTADVSWVDIADIPFFDAPESSAATRDEPFAHMFEGWNRTLARSSRAGGTRVALDGFGGDQLFQVSEHYLLDLWRRGRRLEVIRDWHQRRLGTVAQLIRGVARPAQALKHRAVPWQRFLLRPHPSWLQGEFAKKATLLEREREYLPPDTVKDLSEGETRFFLESPYYALLNHFIAEFALEAGVESRSPLFDDRVVRFAAARPRSERASGRETKRLLRHAVRGLLPEPVLQPRAARTGVTSGYAKQGMAEPFQQIVARAGASPWILEELGIINTQQFRDAIAPDRLAEDGDQRVSAYLTLQTELWLRSRICGSRPPTRAQSTSIQPLDVSRPRGSWAAPSQPLGTL